MSIRTGGVALAVAGIGLVAAPFVLSGRHTSELAVVGAYAIAILGLDVLLGQAGRVSLGQGAFMALGGYTTAILAGTHGVRDLWTIPAAAAVAGGSGCVVALVASRFGTLAPGLVTLGAAAAIPGLAARFPGFTGGGVGLALTGRPFEARHSYALGWLAAALLFLAAWGLSRSRFGRMLRAVRDSPRDAVSAGIDPRVAAGLAWSLAGAYGGIAGSVLVLVLGRADPGVFPLRLSLVLLAGCAIGGLGSIWGALPAALAVRYADNAARVFPDTAGRHAGPGTFLLGAAVVAAVLAASVATAAGRRLRARRLRSAARPVTR